MIILNNEVLVSVIMANYNTPIEYLKESIDSVLSQTLENFELIIIDDCSTDNSADFVLSYSDPRIRLVKNKKNSGPAITRNNGFLIARGKYIAILDSDDIAIPDRFEKQVKYMEDNPDLIACGTWFEKFGIENVIRKPIIEDFDLYRCQLLFSNTPRTMCNSSSMIRKSMMDRYDIKYDTSLQKTEDYGFWVTCSKFGRIDIINDVLVRYRTHPSQISTAEKTSQDEYSDIISRRQLSLLGVDLPDETFKWRYGTVETVEDFIKMHRWFDSIKKANEIKKMFDIAALKKYTDHLLLRGLKILGKKSVPLVLLNESGKYKKDIMRIIMSRKTVFFYEKKHSFYCSFFNSGRH